MDAYLRLVSNAGCTCTGGLKCPNDTPHPTSSAGMNRRGAAKEKSRRAARRLFKLALKTAREVE